ncbi:MAG TPA: ribonuclease E/G, partial [Methylomirabilota bacterium]|nr:ribonuclease E/G [Methylomirabilota bacterium]
MRREIVINAGNHETRIAILEEKELVEVMVERPEARRRVGDIYKGRVNAVLPGMQAAFVDLGLEKTAFLHASDLHPSESDLDEMFEDEESEDGKKDGGDAGGGGGRGRWRRDEPTPRIEEALQKGQEILVQITKEPIGTKGPRVTTQISLPGRYLVLMPGHDHIGVSRKIEDRQERSRLKTLIKDIRPKGSGLIVRTVGSERGKKE